MIALIFLVSGIICFISAYCVGLFGYNGLKKIAKILENDIENEDNYLPEHEQNRILFYNNCVSVGFVLQPIGILIITISAAALYIIY